MAAKKQAIKLEDCAATADTLRTLVDRVELRRDGIELTLDLRSLIPPNQIASQAANPRITRLVPMQMKRRGIETRLVLPGEGPSFARTDPALLRAVARGYCWFAELASGKALSTKQIAAREGLSHSYVRHIVPLGLLAPPIVEAICASRQPAMLTAERLKDHGHLSLDWNAQLQQLSR